MLEAYAKEVDKDLLKDFYYQDDRRTDSAILALEEANAIRNVTESELPDKVFRLKTAMKFFGEDKERVLEAKVRIIPNNISSNHHTLWLLVTNNDYVFLFTSRELQLVDEQIRLLAFQQALEKEDGHRSQYTGLSLNETIRQLLFRNMSKKAEKLRSDFKVPDKRYWNIRLDTLVQSKDWTGCGVLVSFASHLNNFIPLPVVPHIGFDC